jgi:carbamoyltransferase
MNSVANGKIREETPFRQVYVQPAAGDNGTALGAAFHVWSQLPGRSRRFVMDHGYWGPAFGPEAVRRALDARRPDLARQGMQVTGAGDDGRSAASPPSASARAGSWAGSRAD